MAVGVIRFDIVGLGIIMYSPPAVRHIAAGSDYLSAHYWNATDVQQHIQAGTIVAFGTGTPGTFTLNMHPHGPSPMEIDSREFKLRLGIEVKEETICVRDLYDLMKWNPRCPEGQTYALSNGHYRVTLCSDMPSSGVLGDHQLVDVYLEPWRGMPALATVGVPILCQ